MIAIGLAMFVIGFLTMNLAGSDNPWRHNTGDYVGAVLMFFGVLSIVGGAVTWLWRVAP